MSIVPQLGEQAKFENAARLSANHNNASMYNMHDLLLTTPTLQVTKIDHPTCAK